MSNEEDVLLVIPLGMVLASVPFVITITDADRDVRESVVKQFADDRTSVV